MKFQFKTAPLVIMILSFLFFGISMGSFLYAPKASNYILYGGIALFPGLTLLMKARIKSSNSKQERRN